MHIVILVSPESHKAERRFPCSAKRLAVPTRQTVWFHAWNGQGEGSTGCSGCLPWRPSTRLLWSASYAWLFSRVDKKHINLLLLIDFAVLFWTRPILNTSDRSMLSFQPDFRSTSSAIKDAIKILTKFLMWLPCSRITHLFSSQRQRNGHRWSHISTGLDTAKARSSDWQPFWSNQ